MEAGVRFLARHQAVLVRVQSMPPVSARLRHLEGPIVQEQGRLIVRRKGSYLAGHAPPVNNVFPMGQAEQHAGVLIV